MDGKKLKVLMTSDTVGGVWTYALELCRALKPYDIDIHLLGLGAMPDDHQKKEVKLFKNVTFYPTNLKLEWMEDPWEDVLKAEKKIETIVKLVTPDVFHFNNYISETVSFNIPKITMYHSCVQTWWQAVKGCQAPTAWEPYMSHLQNACNTSEVVIFPTEAIQKMAYQAHSLTAPYEVIYNARNMVIADSAVREKIILCTGRIWDEAKNLMLLCEVADQLPWPVYVAGDDQHPGTSKKMVLNNVRFLGKLSSEELKYWLERTEIYINPALYEPFGLAVLEAAKKGCALALGNLDTLQEVWQDNALYFDPRKAEDIMEVLMNLIKDDSLRSDYQKRAKSHSKRYNLKTMGASYHQLYRSLVEKRAAAKSKLNGKRFQINSNF